MGSVEFVEAGIVIVAGELDLELHLILRDGHPANLTRGTDAWTAPRSIWGTSREFPVFDGRSGFLAKEGVRRASGGLPPTVAVDGREQHQMPGGQTPACVTQRARW